MQKEGGAVPRYYIYTPYKLKHFPASYDLHACIIDAGYCDLQHWMRTNNMAHKRNGICHTFFFLLVCVCVCVCVASSHDRCPALLPHVFHIHWDSRWKVGLCERVSRADVQCACVLLWMNKYSHRHEPTLYIVRMGAHMYILYMYIYIYMYTIEK